MATIPPNLTLLLLLLLVVVATTTTTSFPCFFAAAEALPRFREAPQFYNSPGCPPPLPASSAAECAAAEAEAESEAAVHVAMTLDAAYLRGSMAAIHSVLQHASCPQSIRFHFVASAGAGAGVPYLNATIAGSFPSLSFRIYPFADEGRVAGLISTSIRAALDRPLNYARSYLARLLPACARRVVYLDSDLVLVDDIRGLAGTPLPDGAALAAPEYCGANFAAYFTPSFWANPALSNAFAGRRPCYFNTGVMVMDLHRWRLESYTQRIEEWMQLQQRLRIYELGSLPPSCSSSPAASPPSTTDGTSTDWAGTTTRGFAGICTRGPSASCTGAGRANLGSGSTQAGRARSTPSGCPTISSAPPSRSTILESYVAVLRFSSSSSSFSFLFPSPSLSLSLSLSPLFFC
uniref:Hexosyltransferase n=1 Tax=Ananas comosus var. bracteatus TaxID=296719 RepID=A0A6V7NLP0_ANACO|nr:unnamed protein product [Ananas comosus var. bracteatus]